MIRIGRKNTLQVAAEHEVGLLLDAGDHGEVLLPKRYVPEGLKPGGEIEIFLSFDSDDRLIATTHEPLAMAGEFALLDVIASTRVGSFLDWGMPKDLMLPFGEQPQRVRVGEKVLVHVYHDEVSNRMVASAKLRKFVEDTAPIYLRQGNQVDLLIAEVTDIGTRAIVSDKFWGMFSLEEKVPPIGTRCEGFISRIREDGLVDLSLKAPGYEKIPEIAKDLLAALQAAPKGFLPLHDKSPPEEIRAQLGVSKKIFKQAVGALYKAKRITLEEGGIQLVG